MYLDNIEQLHQQIRIYTDEIKQLGLERDGLAAKHPADAKISELEAELKFSSKFFTNLKT